MRQNLFRAKLAENGLSQKDVAKELGMAENTLTHKIREKSFFGVNDVKKMSKLLNLNKDDIFDIFFTDDVEKNRQERSTRCSHGVQAI